MFKILIVYFSIVFLLMEYFGRKEIDDSLMFNFNMWFNV